MIIFINIDKIIFINTTVIDRSICYRNRFCQAGNRFLAPLKGLEIWAESGGFSLSKPTAINSCSQNPGWSKLDFARRDQCKRFRETLTGWKSGKTTYVTL